ncbi:hypothetical protein H6771_01895 [Candidatus Peribacteria bacterium]|nr:hypothetical protein [Candidatus Peribacteria bacterium]
MKTIKLFLSLSREKQKLVLGNALVLPLLYGIVFLAMCFFGGCWPLEFLNLPGTSWTGGIVLAFAFMFWAGFNSSLYPFKNERAPGVKDHPKLRESPKLKNLPKLRKPPRIGG